MDIPARQHLIRRVRAALAAPFSAPLYLCGSQSTGKQSTLEAAAGENARCVVIDCVLNHTERQLFTIIAESDSNVSDSSLLIEMLRSDPPSDNLHILVFNRAERLSPSAFPLLFRLPVLCERPDLRIVFSSRVPFSSLRYSLATGGSGPSNAHGHPVATPAVIFFTPLSRPEIVDALTMSFQRSKPTTPKQEVKIYSGFAGSVVEILYRTSNNPHHLQRVTDALFPDYMSALSHQKSPLAAFNRIRDRLTDTLSALTDDMNINMNPNSCLNSTSINGDQHQQNDKTSGLPRTARILLVAAFLGRVIAPSHDMRHFSAERTGRRAATQKAAANNAVPLERLLAIYRSIRPQGPIGENGETDLTPKSIFNMNNWHSNVTDTEEEDTSVSSAISTAALIHLSTLVALGWLSREGGGGSNPSSDISLSEPKFRCKLSHPDAVKIAGSLDMNIHDYLVFDK